MISVIIPVFNAEKTISSCLDSVLSETFQDLEIILVNDGSTDDSGKLIELFRKRDKRIKVYQKENGGLSSVRNYGIDRATGEYLAFVDADD